MPQTAIITPLQLLSVSQNAFKAQECCPGLPIFDDTICWGLDFFFNYLDDILVASRNSTEHKIHLHDLFLYIQDHGLFVNVAKYQFGLNRIDFLATASLIKAPYFYQRFPTHGQVDSSAPRLHLWVYYGHLSCPGNGQPWSWCTLQFHHRCHIHEGIDYKLQWPPASGITLVYKLTSQPSLVSSMRMFVLDQMMLSSSVTLLGASFLIWLMALCMPQRTHGCQVYLAWSPQAS